MRRQRLTWLLSAVALISGFALMTAAYGFGGNQASSTSAAKAKHFANFKIALDTSLDFLDPGLSYTVQGWATMWNVYGTLLTYPHLSGPKGATLVPGLAQSLPKVSSGGKVYKFTLRKGLRYSNGRALKASDFKYTIKRLFIINSPGVGFYEDIVGAKAFEASKKGDIPGVVVNNKRRTVTFKLTGPRGDFLNLVALLFASPVPTGTPAKDQAGKIPTTGPYKISSYRPLRSYTMVRNKYFKPTRYTPAGNPDKITVNLVESDTAALQQAIGGQVDYNFHTIPVDRLGEVTSKYSKQLKIYTPANTFYFFMNTRTPPFDKLKVRQAVEFAINRSAIVRLYGGLARPTQNVLPPTYPSYNALHLYKYDLNKATQLIKQAGAAGAKVTVWGRSRPYDQRAVEYLNDQLNKIGLKSELKILDPSVYWTTIGNQSSAAQIGFADWFQDYPHPLDWFDVLLNGKRITDLHNNNFSNANVPAINNQIEKLKLQPVLTPKVNAAWAAVDRMVMARALWAPYLNRNNTDFFNKRVDLSCYVNQVLYGFDWATICVK